MMTNDELLSKATAFIIWGVPGTPSFDLKVEFRGNDGWAITKPGFCYCRKVNWFVWEPSASSRDEEFISTTRFSRDQAITIAEELAKKFQDEFDKYVAGGKRGYFQPDIAPKELYVLKDD